MRRPSDARQLPRIYLVNWFRKDERGKFVWPGFGENSRVLKWIVERLEGTATATDTAIGRVPPAGALDVEDLALSDAQLATLLSVDRQVWREEAGLSARDLERLGRRVPPALLREQTLLEGRLA